MKTDPQVELLKSIPLSRWGFRRALEGAFWYLEHPSEPRVSISWRRSWDPPEWDQVGFPPMSRRARRLAKAMMKERAAQVDQAESAMMEQRVIRATNEAKGRYGNGAE